MNKIQKKDCFYHFISNNMSVNTKNNNCKKKNIQCKYQLEINRVDYSLKVGRKD